MMHILLLPGVLEVVLLLCYCQRYVAKDEGEFSLRLRSDGLDEPLCECAIASAAITGNSAGSTGEGMEGMRMHGDSGRLAPRGWTVRRSRTQGGFGAARVHNENESKQVFVLADCFLHLRNFIVIEGLAPLVLFVTPQHKKCALLPVLEVQP